MAAAKQSCPICGSNKKTILLRPCNISYNPDRFHKVRYVRADKNGVAVWDTRFHTIIELR